MTTIIVPNGDGTRGNWVDFIAGTTNLYTNVDEGTSSPNDSDGIRCNSVGSAIYLLLQDTPADFSSMDSTITLKIRANNSSSKGTNFTIGACRIVQSDESTALTSASAGTDQPTTTYALYTYTLSVTGATDKTSWDGARVKLVCGSGSSGFLQISAVQVEFTYTPTATSAAGVIGGGVSLSGIVGYQSSVLCRGEDVRQFKARREYDQINARLKERCGV